MNPNDRGTPARAAARKTLRSKWVLAGALFALSALFAAWFHDDRHGWVTLGIFALPPLLLLLALRRHYRAAAFWSGVLSLAWFSHGVMVAYSRPQEALFAWLEVLLALVVIGASNWPGLSARFGRRR